MAVSRQAELVVASVGKLMEVVPPVMVVLQTDCGGVMRTCEGSFGEARGPVLGWEKIEIL